jgi:membrane protein implicated in regulation of membrane protease activity
MDWLQSLYIAASIFGVGITLIDLLGLFGHHGHPADITGHAADTSGHGGDHSGAGHDAGGHVGGDHGIVGHDTGGHGGGHADGGFDHAIGGHDGATGHDTATDHVGDHLAADHSVAGHHAAGHHGHSQGGEQTSVVSQDRRELQRALKVSPLLRVLTVLRSLVYFAFGFGPTGLVALASGLGAFLSFVLAVPVGALFIGGGFLVRKLQTRELDSTVHDEELVLEEGTVIVPIEPGKIGKVRIELGGSFVERFARARRPEATFKINDRVQIVEATDEFLIVEDQYGGKPGGEK